MSTPDIDSGTFPLPRHVAVIGAAGGLGQGILRVCRKEGIGFTAIVRSRPERITDVADGSRVAVVKSLADGAALTEAFTGANAVLAVLGTTSTSYDSTALLSANMPNVEASMIAADVDRILIINTLIASQPGQPPGRWMLEEAVANRFVRAAPFVSRGRR